MKISLTFYLLLIVVYVGCKPTCSDLPRHCKYVTYFRFFREKIFKNQFPLGRSEEILCENAFDDEQMLDSLRKVIMNCSSFINIAVNQLRGHEVIDKSFDAMFRLDSMIKKSITMKIQGLRGFDIETQFYLKNLFNLRLNIDFKLFKNNKIVKDCADFEGSRSKGFMFQNSQFNLIIYRPKNVHPICSLFFRNAPIGGLTIFYTINSYYVRNTISFVDYPGGDNFNLNSSLQNFEMNICFGMNISPGLLNKNIFKNVVGMNFLCQIDSIHPRVFEPFGKLKSLRFLSNIIHFIRKQGTDWIKTLNANVSVNLLNRKLLRENIHLSFTIELRPEFNYIVNPNVFFAYDEDFCLFRDFPSRQLVFFILLVERPFTDSKACLTCTELWLSRYYKDFISEYTYTYRTLELINSSNLTSCNYSNRLKLCSKANFTRFEFDNSTRYSMVDFVTSTELFLIFLTPVLSLHGLITNLVVIYVISDEKNAKTMTKKHYKYMCLHCVCNVLISFAYLLSPLHECQYVGIFCSAARKYVFIQYVKIILGEYMSNVCRLLANFTYLGFSLCRMSQIGKDHGKLIVFLDTKLTIKIYMAVCVVVSAGACVCKVLVFDINVDLLDLPYPLPFSQNTNKSRWMLYAPYVAITVVNTVYDFLNYVVFVCIHLCVDLVLVKKIRATIAEKDAKMRQMKHGQELDKALKESEDSKHRVLNMVIFCSVFNLLTKVPLMITSLNNCRIIFTLPFGKKEFLLKYNESLQLSVMNPFRVNMTFRYFCSFEKSCLVFQNFGNCLFLASSSATVYFLKSFDMNFKSAYETSFPRKIKNQPNQTNIKTNK